MQIVDIAVAFLTNPLVTLLIGSGITWFFAWYYYRRAGEELRVEAAHLRKTSELTLRWLESKGENVEVIRDDQGRPTGLLHHVSVVESLSVNATVIGGELREVRDDERA